MTSKRREVKLGMDFKWIKCWLLIVFLSLGQLVIAQKVEAEDGFLEGTEIGNSHAGFSGSGYVTSFDNDGDAVRMKLSVAQAGLYDLFIGYAGPYGEKTNDIYVNGEFAGGQIFLESQIFRETRFGKVNLLKGDNSIKVVKNWGYFELDYIRAVPAVPNDIHQYSEELVNPNATQSAQLLYRFIRDYYGHKIIAGQQATDGGYSELNYLDQHTGKQPAIKGFDLIDYSPSRVENGTTSRQTERSVDWSTQQGGLVTQMWHWNAPKDLLDTEDAPWWSGFYTYATTFDPRIAMNDQSSEEYQLIVRDIDVIAAELKVIAEADVPILWRPLHEAEGGWFWWGAYGPEPCVWLWEIMYERLTEHHKLNNLVWVWTGTNSEDALDWYPGDEYVDIIGADIYLEDQNYATSFSMFDEMAGIHEGKKIITLSETKTIPEADALMSDRARWSWFMVWSGGFILDGVQNELSHVNAMYNHEYVITLDELPDFENYVSPDFPDDDSTGVIPLATAPGKLTDIYPNPTVDYIQIHHPSPGEILLVDVFDMKGNRVLHSAILQDERINLDSLKSGVYIVKANMSSGPVGTSKIVKQ